MCEGIAGGELCVVKSLYNLMCCVLSPVAQDQLGGRARRNSSVVADTGSDTLMVDCTNPGQFVIGSPHTIKLNHFFDKVCKGMLA